MSEVKINRLILIGNGFDLANGLKTSFYDFINFIVYETVLYLETGTKNPLGIDNNIFETDFDVKVNYGRLLSLIRESKSLISNVDQNDEIIKKIYEIPDKIEEKYDVEYNYIEKYSLLFDENFLMDITNYLLIPPIYGFMKGQEIKYPLNNFLSGKKLFKNKLFEIIFKNAIPRNEKSKNWGGIEHDFYQTLLNVDKIYEKNDKKDKIEILNDEFKDIIICLQGYLNYIDRYHNTSLDDTVKAIKKHLKEPIVNIELSNTYKKKIGLHFEDNIKLSEIIFLNFNYTRTISNYIESNHNDINAKEIQIHGHLFPDSSIPNQIIFGYGDEMDGSYKELEERNDNRYLKYFKSLHYLFDQNYKNLLDFLEQEKYQVYIWGHSCATSDRVLLQTIFEHENCVSVKPFYYRNEKGNDNFADLCANISRSFKDKKKFRDLLVNKLYCTTL